MASGRRSLDISLTILRREENNQRWAIMEDFMEKKTNPINLDLTMTSASGI